MKFGLFYEISVPRPWTRESDRTVYQNALEQVKLADELGFDQVWAVEHHFLEEYSHCPAPELFLTACAMVTKKIRVGHGIVVCVPEFNHPINPKPVIFSAYRDYGRFGLTFATTIPANAEATYRCRFLVVFGEMPPAELIQKLSNEYTGASDPVPPITLNKAEVFKTAAPKAPATPANSTDAPKPAPAK